MKELSNSDKKELYDLVLEKFIKYERIAEIAKEGYDTIVPPEEQELLEKVNPDFCDTRGRRRIYFLDADGSRFILRMDTYRPGYVDGRLMEVDESHVELHERARKVRDDVTERQKKAEEVKPILRRILNRHDTVESLVAAWPKAQEYIDILEARRAEAAAEDIEKATSILGD